jgi:hypothetical protein
MIHHVDAKAQGQLQSCGFWRSTRRGCRLSNSSHRRVPVSRMENQTVIGADGVDPQPPVQLAERC